MGSKAEQYKSTKRNIRTAKASFAFSRIKDDDARTYFLVRAIDTPWQKGTLRLIRAVKGETMPIPAMGTNIELVNRETGLWLGFYEVMPSPSKSDPLYGHNIPVWDLCATDDERASKQAKSAPSASQPATAPAVTLTVARDIVPARRVSTRERVSAFTPKRTKRASK
jgi:hypothetical protein